MFAFVRRNLSLKHKSPLCGRFSLALHFLSTSRDISPTVSDILIRKYKFPSELVTKLTCFENLEKVDSVLSFFKESGFSNSQLVKIVRYRPRLLLASVEDSLKPKIKILQHFGFSSDDIFKITSNNPGILHLSANNNIIPSLSEMKSLFGSNNEVVRVLKSSPRFLTANLKNNVIPNVEFLKSCGIPMSTIYKTICKFPSPFLAKTVFLRKSAEKTKEMGLSVNSKSFIYAILTIASMSNETWELKVQAFRDMGFSDSDILTMFSKWPRVFCLSVDKIKKLKELLIATGKFNMANIIHRPVSLGYSIEKRYKPRLKILEILESRNLVKEWPGLGTIGTSSDVYFFEKFISPYLEELSDVDIPKYFTRIKEGETISICLKN